jgi:diguanylate cyclase (GGDEF)-like protein/PAS domain S-box-containing protein
MSERPKEIAFWAGKNAASRKRALSAKSIGTILICIVLGVAISLSILAWSALEFHGRQLSLDTTGSVLPWVVLFGALSLGLLTFGLIRLLAASGQRAAAWAERITDILRSSESDLAEAQRAAQEVIEAFPNPIFFKAVNGRHIGADEAWQKLFGVSRANFVSNLVRELYARQTEGADAPHTMSQIIRQNPRKQVFKTTITTGAGERVESRHQKAAFLQADSSDAGLIGTVINIVERKESEFFDMLGFTKEELINKTIKDVTHPVDYSQVAQLGERVAQGAMISLATEKVCVREDGKIGWDKRIVSVVSDRTGKPDYLLCAVEDVTDRKLGEQRQAMEHAISLVLADSETVSETIAKMIQGICQAMEWQFGMYWNLDQEAKELGIFESWGLDTPELREFMADRAQQAAQLAPAGAQDFVQRAYLSGKPAWIANVAREPGFTPQMAAQAGLQGAIAFPILLGNKALGVMEFYHRDAPEPNGALLTTLRSIGSQIGQYLVRMDAEGALRVAAAPDALTKLPNREIFHQRLDHAFIQAQRRGGRIAVLFIDIDHFKIVNDTLGHEAGDTLLREVASRLTENLRASDTVARLGGDEFVVLIEDVSDPMYIGSLAKKLIGALGASYLISGHECQVTASIGSSTYPDDCEDTMTLLKNADIAMYRAKELGRNGFQFYNEQMNASSVERSTLESGLRQALERNELLLHYQPKIDIRSGQVTGLEALVRWKHPDMGLVPPAHFMQIANETGLIVPIGEWVLQTAFVTRKGWERQGLRNTIVAVNLSRRQFMHGSLLKNIEQVLKETGCSANAIALEITESMVMHNPERAIQLISSLKSIGLQVVIDDFGTGYSSLAYLQRFPVDALKIDRSFMDISGDAGNKSIAQAIIAMAHSLKLNVIAEGVETKEQVDFLREHGCDEIQGYYVSKPLAAADAVAFIQEKTGNISSIQAPSHSGISQ